MVQLYKSLQNFFFFSFGFLKKLGLVVQSVFIRFIPSQQTYRLGSIFREP